MFARLWIAWVLFHVEKGKCYSTVYLAIYITVACLLFGLLRLYMVSMVKEFPDGRKTKEIIQTAIALISPRSSVNTAYLDGPDCR